MTGVARLFLSRERAKLADLRRRIEAVVIQLSEENLNWRPDDDAPTVTNLVLRTCGGITQRLAVQVVEEADTRTAAEEIAPTTRRSAAQLQSLIAETFTKAEEILSRLPQAVLFEEKRVADQVVTLLDVIATASAAAAEQYGQMISIARSRLGAGYREPAGPEIAPRLPDPRDEPPVFRQPQVPVPDATSAWIKLPPGAKLPTGLWKSSRGGPQ
jgi:hypothetical protein